MATLLESIIARFNIPLSKKNLVLEFLQEHKITKISALPKSICNVLQYDPDFENLTGRYNYIKTFKKDSTTLNAWIARYGEKIGTLKYNERKQRLSFTSSKKYQSEKFGEEEYIKKKRSIGKQTMIERHGISKGTELWNEYLNKWKKSSSKEGRIEKYGVDVGTEYHNKIVDKFKYTNSLDGYIDRYGEELGTEKWHNKNKQIKYKNSKAYYIEKYGENYANILRRVKDTLSLDSYISRHGIEEGTKLYKHRCKQLSEFAKEHKSVLHFNPSNFYSKVSQRFFKDLHLLLGEVFCMYGENNGEYFIYEPVTKQIYFYDFICNNKIIEFHGDYWHKNPRFYEPDMVVMEKDMRKKIAAEDKGKKLLVIWEYDYYKNPELTLQTALNFINNE